MPKDPSVMPYEGPAGGWGSVQSLGRILVSEVDPRQCQQARANAAAPGNER
jgi:hypothetical protein